MTSSNRRPDPTTRPQASWSGGFRHARNLVASLALLVTGACTAHGQTCDPKAQAAAHAHMPRMQRVLDSNPSDAIALFSLAVDHVAACEDEEAFGLLERMVTAPGGLDPSVYRGFARVRASPRFREILARIRQANSPIIASVPTFTIARPNLFPEGMAYDSASHRVYVGSQAGRIIVWTDSTATLHEFVSSGQDRLGAVLGLHIDPRRHHLWAVSTGATGPGSAEAVRGLFQYDLGTGRLIRRFEIPDTTSEVTFNDVVVVPSTGVAYTTYSTAGTVYAAAPGDSILRQVAPAGSIPQANGITVSPDEEALFVAGGFGIVLLNPRTQAVTSLPRSPGVIDVTIDGLYWYDRSLIGIQNGVHPGRVLRFYLDSSLTRITGAKVLETYNPLFDSPTTGAVSGDAFFFMANPQRRRLSPGGPDSANLKPVRVMRLPLQP